MIPVVFDCGVLVSAIGWAGNPRRCLRLIAQRQIRLCATAEVWDEYETRIPAVLAVRRPGIIMHGRRWTGCLAWQIL